LTAFAGNTRESRKSPQKFNDAIKKFNEAVDYNNGT